MKNKRIFETVFGKFTFEFKGRKTTCYVNGNKVSEAVRGKKDRHDTVYGMKVALRRAIVNYDKGIRKMIWDKFFDTYDYGSCVRVRDKRKTNRRLPSIVAVILLLFSFTGATFAQNSVIINGESYSNYVSYENSKSTINVDNFDFDVIVSRNKLLYTIRHSKSGKPYKYYIGKPTKYKFMGRRVYTNSKSTKYYYYTVSDEGKLVRHKLIKNEKKAI